MNGERVVHTLLSQHAPLVALLAAPTNIFPSTVPLGTIMPAVNYEVVSRMERTTVSSEEPTVMVRYRIQVDCHARTYETCAAMVAQVRAALANRRGTVAGVQAVTIRPEFQGIDVYNEDADFYSRSSDFLITLQEAVS